MCAHAHGGIAATRAETGLAAVPLPADERGADGCHLIVRSISLTGGNLIVDWAFAPEPAAEADLWPEIRYGADVSPRGWNQWRADFDVFERPVPKARQVWFDFFQPYYEWYGHFDRHGQPDDDYLRNRVARITVDLKTGAAQIEDRPR